MRKTSKQIANNVLARMRKSDGLLGLRKSAQGEYATDPAAEDLINALSGETEMQSQRRGLLGGLAAGGLAGGGLGGLLAGGPKAGLGRFGFGLGLGALAGGAGGGALGRALGGRYGRSKAEAAVEPYLMPEYGDQTQEY